MSAYKVVKRGDFVLAPMALYYGAIGRLRDVAEGLVSPAYDVFAVGSEVDAAFFENLIRSPALIAKYNALSVGGNRAGKRKTTTFRDFCTIEWPVPSLATQRVIGSVLDAIDANASAQDNALRERGRAKQAVMREILTRGLPGRRRGSKPLPSSWPIGRITTDIADIPVHWNLVPLLSVSRLESGHTPSRAHPEYWGGSVPWLSLNDTDEIKKLVVERTTETITELGVDNSSARMLPSDSVVLTRTAVRGLASRLGTPMTVSQDLVAFLCGPHLLPRYLVQVLRCMQREWRRLEAGTSPTNKTIYFADFERLKVLLPPKDEQGEIADIGDAFDRAIDGDRAHRAKLTELRAALANALYGGKVSVAPSSVGGAT